MDRQEFIAFLRGTRNVVDAQDGGYLIPKRVRRDKKGFTAWFWRLLKNERGYEYVNLHEKFEVAVKGATINCAGKGK